METLPEVVDHAAVAAVIVYVLQWLKQASWFSWISVKTPRLNRFISVMLAAVAAIGITWTYDPTAGTLTVTGLTLMGVFLAGYEWFKQFLLQQFVFDMVKPRRS